MRDNLRTLIKDYKNGDKSKFLGILEKMKPQIMKYVRILYKDEKEDTYSELVLYLLEALNKMEYYDTEGQCVYYMSKALQNKFHELYKKSRKHFDHTIPVDTESFYDYSYTPVDYDDIIAKEDLSKLISCLPDRQHTICYAIVFRNESDTIIGDKYEISRQYVNRVRKKLYKLLTEEYLC